MENLPVNGKGERGRNRAARETRNSKFGPIARLAAFATIGKGALWPAPGTSGQCFKSGPALARVFRGRPSEPESGVRSEYAISGP